DEQFELGRFVTHRVFGKRRRSDRTRHRAGRNTEHCAAAEIGHTLLPQCGAATLSPHRFDCAAPAVVRGSPQMPFSHCAFSKVKVKSDALAGTWRVAALP